jgi:hypothetical protein
MVLETANTCRVSSTKANKRCHICKQAQAEAALQRDTYETVLLRTLPDDGKSGQKEFARFYFMI